MGRGGMKSGNVCSAGLIYLLVVCSFIYPAGQGEEGPAPSARTDQSEGRIEAQRTEEKYKDAHQSMVRSQLYDRGITDWKVLGAMSKVPRHLFVPEAHRARSYADSPLPIGHGQTISQPYIVALMTWLLDISEGDRILEIGTGSGYQAAVLAELTDQVYSMEIIEPLAEAAGRALKEAGYSQVKLRRKDGYFGWPEAAPFQGIIITAAAGHVPPPLVEQLAPGGRLILPLGHPYQVQILTLIEKDEDGNLSSNQLLPVRFVPMTGRVGGGES